MHRLKNLAFVILVPLSITACSIEEKPDFFIGDSELRVYQGGDSLTYTLFEAAIDTDRTGRYSITLESKAASLPGNNGTVTLLFEQLVKNGNFTNPFLPQYFSQNALGELVLEAIGSGEDILWLLDTDETETGEILYPADLSTLSEQISGTKKLQRCNQNRDCFDAGQYAFSLKPLGIETVETPYANFETFKFDILVELQISDVEQAGNSKNYILDGEQWFYPLLGVVKFVYNVENPTTRSTLIGDLSSTNISIDEIYETATTSAN